MKLAICSDLHLEFAPLTIDNPHDAKVLILSGDILVEKDLDEYVPEQIASGFARAKSTEYHKFFLDVCSKFEYVLYVLGNHEHYHGDFKYTASELKKKLAHNKNLYILDKESINIDGVTFVGSTLWTDMNKGDLLTLYHVKRMMSDFSVIRNGNRMVTRRVPLYEENPLYTPDGKNGGKYSTQDGYYIKIGEKDKVEPSTFCPEDVVEENRKCFDYIKHVVEQNDKVVVIGHHTPSHQSCHPRWKEDTIMNGAYHNSYEDYITDHEQIVLWTHGHTHEPYDYMIGGARIVCNPRGYKGHEKIAEDFTMKVIEL